MKKQNLHTILIKINLRKLLLPLLVIILIVLVFIFNPYQNSIKTVDLDDIKDIGSCYDNKDRYINISVDDLYYTGLDYTIRNDVKGSIYYSIINDKCYFFILKNSTASDEGHLSDVTLNVRLEKDDELYQQLVKDTADKLAWTYNGLNSVSSPILLDEYAYTNGIVTAAIVILMVLGGVMVINVFISLFCIAVPSISWPMRILGKFGNKFELFDQAEYEFDNVKRKVYENIYITDSFLIAYNKSALAIVPLEHIAWAYKFNTLHRIKIRPALANTICIVTDTKKTIKIHKRSEATADYVLTTLSELYPEILIGYNND